MVVYRAPGIEQGAIIYGNGPVFMEKVEYISVKAKAWTKQFAFIGRIIRTILGKDSSNHLNQLCPFY